MNNGTAKLVEQDSVNVGLMSWELDFFGRIRSLKSRALNQHLATEQAQASARISLVAAVAQAYLAYAADQENLTLATATFEAQKAYHDLIAKSRALGVASDLSGCAAQSQMETARADVAKFRGSVAVDRHALDLVAGTPVPVDLLPKGPDAAGELKRPRRGPFLRRCCCAVPTSSWPSTSSRRPTGTSARRGRPSSRASASPRASAP